MGSPVGRLGGSSRTQSSHATQWREPSGSRHWWSEPFYPLEAWLSVPVTAKLLSTSTVTSSPAFVVMCAS
jgi:hypothetical protein